MNKITEITRRKIFDFLIVSDIHWWGKISELDFLARVFDIDNIPSYDGRYKTFREDYCKHCINNDDWPSDWIYQDDRFDLMHCNDDLFLKLLSEMIHPVVRINMDQVAVMLANFNDILKPDGYELYENDKISGYSVFWWGQVGVKNEVVENHVKEIESFLSTQYVSEQITIMNEKIETAPHVAIGMAKELIEICCKSIFELRTTEYDKNWDLQKLIKETNQILKLTPSDIPDEKKAADIIRKILGSLTAVVQGICELRNDYGTGHGKSSKFKGLNPRHARLAVGAASTLANFLIETHLARD